MAIAIQYPLRVKETSTTTGTGTYTLAGAASGHQAFSDEMSDTEEVYYLASEGTSWEYGIGTLGASGTTLARTSVIQSTNADAAVNWTTGTRTITAVAPAEFFQYRATSDVAATGGAATGDGAAAYGESTAYLLGMVSFGYGKRSALGDSQRFALQFSALTTNASSTTMVLGGDDLATNGTPDLVDNRLYVFDGLVGAWQTGGVSGSVGDSGAYHIRGAIKQVSGTTSLVGSVTVTTIGEDDATWDVAVTADNTDDRIDIAVTGAANKNISWVAHVNFIEVG